MARVTVLVSDGETLFREGVCALLKNYAALEIVGEASNGQETIEMIREGTPDVVLMNIEIPIINGAEVTRRIRKENSATKVLLLTQYEDRDRIISGLRAGANGYILKRATASELVSAILVVYRGGYVLYPSVVKTIVDDYFQQIRQPGSSDSYERLTDRERKVLKLVAKGHKNSEIAEFLAISIKTVSGYRTNIMRKLRIHSRAELVKYAIYRHLDLEN